MKCTDPSSKWRTHCSTKRICKNKDYGENMKLKRFLNIEEFGIFRAWMAKPI